jgi:release factor glutamine methyltransferase
VAIAAATPVDLYATDIDPVAVACAGKNLERFGGRVFSGDLFEPLPPELYGRINVLTANVPYIPSGTIELLPREARLYEPRVALDGGDDGLDVLRRLATSSSAWLAPAGHLLVETSKAQAEAAAGIVRDAGLEASVVRDDSLDATVVIGSR